MQILERKKNEHEKSLQNYNEHAKHERKNIVAVKSFEIPKKEIIFILMKIFYFQISNSI